MFFYLYDAFVLDKKFAPILDRIESRIIELGINGRVEKLTPLRNIKEIIELGIKAGAHTIVVVGNDHTFLKALQVVAQHTTCALGFLPIGESQLGSLFGITDPLEGCNTLSRRITKQLPLGKANQTFFLSEVTADFAAGTVLRCNEQWNLITQTEHTICTITNPGSRGHESNQLQVTLEPQGNSSSWLRKAKRLHPTTVLVNKVSIDHPESAASLALDHTTVLKSPVGFSIKPKAIKVIVGKQRKIHWQSPIKSVT